MKSWQVWRLFGEWIATIEFVRAETFGDALTAVNDAIAIGTSGFARTGMFTVSEVSAIPATVRGVPVRILN